MKMNYLKDSKPVWAKAKDWKDCTPEERAQANLRVFYQDEIILDADGNLSEVLEALDRDGINYKVWTSSGAENKGHVHIKVEEMLKLSPNQRTHVRATYIMRYNCDLAKASGHTFIARENKPHFKSGKVKTLIKNVGNGRNVGFPVWVGDIPEEKDVEKFAGGTVKNKIKCPFPEHDDHDPSCAIYDKSFFCFGCQRYGSLEVLKNIDKAKHTETKGGIFYWIPEDGPGKEIELKTSKRTHANTLITQDIPKIEWLIHHFIGKGTVNILAGEPSTAKSFLMLYAAFKALLDKQFLDTLEILEEMKVMFIDEENGIRRQQRRLKQLCEGYGIKKEDYEKLKTISFLMDTGIVLDSNTEVVQAQVMAVLEQAISDDVPDLIVIDSMTRFMRGSENDVKDVRNVFNILKKIAGKYGCAIVVIHHTRKLYGDKPDHNYIRGSGDFQAMADGTFMISRQKIGGQDVFRLEVTKSRDGYEFKPIGFMIHNTSEDDEHGVQFVPQVVRSHQEENNLMLETCEALLKWIEDGSLTVFTTKEARAATMTGDTTLKNALAELVGCGRIKRTKRGQYEFIS